MERYRQSFVFSERDSKIAHSRGNHKYAVWIDDLPTRNPNSTISVSKFFNEYLSDPLEDFHLEIRKSIRINSFVTSEISKRLTEKSVYDANLDEEFRQRCRERHGLGENVEDFHVDKLQEMTLERFKTFRLFYQSDFRGESFRSLQAPLASGFVKSDYSIWADIQLPAGLKCLCGTIDAAYWIDQSRNHIGIIDWNTSESIERPIPVTNQTSPFFNSERTLLQKSQCKSHLYAAILETKYGLTVTANIVHLRDDDFVIYPVGNWNSCACVGLFQFI